MPRVMIVNVPVYFVILPETTYVILERLSQVRRISPTAAPGRCGCRGLVGYSDQQMDRQRRS
jgi:hypothetical protein